MNIKNYIGIGRSQPVENIVYGDCPIIQTDSFVHLGIL